MSSRLSNLLRRYSLLCTSISALGAPGVTDASDDDVVVVLLKNTGGTYGVVAVGVVVVSRRVARALRGLSK